MKETFKVNIRQQIRSLNAGLWLLLTIPVGLIFLHLIGKITIDDYPGVLIGFLLFNLFWFLPVFYLHIAFYITNHNMELTIDNSAKRISIIDQSNISHFTFEDIQIVEQHLGIYFKNRIDNRGRFLAPWSYYGYIKLKLKNGKNYYLSSLMLDVLNPPLTTKLTKYRIIPFIDSHEVSIQEKRNRIVLHRQERMKKYVEKFAGLSRETLQEKVDNPSRYEPSAVAASIYLLDQDSKAATIHEENNDR